MARTRAPEIVGGPWHNVAVPLSMAALRGRVVVLHFFTASCVNCQRMVAELRGLEARSGAGDLVVVGVRIPRFDAERPPAALRDAIDRLGLTHPVVDDPDGATGDRYGVRAWPTVVVVDPDGYVVGSTRGDGHGPEIERAVAATLAGHPGGAAPTARPRPSGRPAGGVLAWPAKVAVHPDGLVVADSGHDRVLVVDLDGLIVAEHEGLRGPTGVRAQADGTLLVCERDADRVVRISPAGRRTVILAEVASPADVAVAADGTVLVAEAGRHRIWRLTPGRAPAVEAGTGEEGLEDAYGPAALFAQPSGLATGPLGLFVVDAESSALRVVDARHRVATLLGRGTATWGSADGTIASARMQHPEGVACAPDGSSVYIADTFNSILRLWSGVDGELRTLAVDGLLQPGGLDVLADGRLVVADTGNHRIVLVDLAADTLVPLAVRRLPEKGNRS